MALVKCFLGPGEFNGAAPVLSDELRYVVGAGRLKRNCHVFSLLLNSASCSRKLRGSQSPESSDRARCLMMHKMMEVIPQFDYRLRQIVLVAKRAQARSTQQETSAGLGFKPEPSRGQYPQKVPARKDHHVAFDLAHPVNHTIGPRSNLVG